MVTPAFIGARARKFNHDCSQGRVIPLTPAKKASVLVEPLTTEFRPKTTANKEEDKPASRFKTTNSAPGRVRSYRGSENGEKKTLIGKVFLHPEIASSKNRASVHLRLIVDLTLVDKLNGIYLPSLFFYFFQHSDLISDHYTDTLS